MEDRRRGFWDVGLKLQGVDGLVIGWFFRARTSLCNVLTGGNAFLKQSSHPSGIYSLLLDEDCLSILAA